MLGALRVIYMFNSLCCCCCCCCCCCFRGSRV